MLSAFCMSFIAWILILASLAAISEDGTNIKNVAWVKGTTTLDATAYPPSGASLTSYLGLTARVDEITTSSGTTSSTIKWDATNSCVVGGLTGSQCQECADNSGGAQTFMITGAITQIFQMTTDLQRMTRYGDLNCQKSLGTITGIYGTYSGLQALATFMSKCANRGWGEWFREGASTSFVVTATGAPATSQIDYSGNAGFVLILIATLLRGFDVLIHLIVPTPPANQFKAQEGCDGATLSEYRSLVGMEPTEWNQPVDSSKTSGEPVEASGVVVENQA